jgi:uncharacterized membrane protein YphA (DoxX/SURF4 family)
MLKSWKNWAGDIESTDCWVTGSVGVCGKLPPVPAVDAGTVVVVVGELGAGRLTVIGAVVVVVGAVVAGAVVVVVGVVPVEPLAPKTGVEGGFAISLPDSMTAP